MSDICPYNLGNSCKLTNINYKAEQEEFYENTCNNQDYLNCPHLTRTVYAAKTYYFIGPSRCCPYISKRRCDLRDCDVCDRHRSFYKSTCCTSRYHDRCSYFSDRVSVIKENRHFKASYRCPYLLDNYCYLRQIDVYDSNRTFFRFTCTTSDYHRKCPFYLEKISRLKCKPNLKVYDRCPHIDGDRCRIRKIDVRKRCREHYDYSCCTSNYIKTCPYYVESLCDD